TTETTSSAVANGTTETTVTKVPLPDRNPMPPSTVGVASLAGPTAPSSASQTATDMPLPDANPSRSGTSEAPKGTLTLAIAAPRPAMDYAAILKPILDYQLSASDAANINDVLHSSTAGASQIKDPAARDFVLWYKYRFSPGAGSAEAIEQF